MPSARLSAFSPRAIAAALMAGALIAGGPAILPGRAIAQPSNATDPVPPRPAPDPAAPGMTAPVVTPQILAPQLVPAPQATPAPPDAPTARQEKAASEEALRAAEAEAPEDAERAAACKAHALARLKARSPSVDDIFLDMDGLTIATADLMVGQEKITAVLMGEAYIKRDRSDRAHRFLCLVGEKDKVVMTFLTER